MRFQLIVLLVFGPIALLAQRKDHASKIIEEINKNNSYTFINAHRGDWSFYPENSLAAYQACIDQGFDMIEIDVQKTKDGKLIIMHDATVDRTTTGKGKVSDLEWQAIQKLKLKTPIGRRTDMKVPTLEEVFKLAKGNILLQVDKWPGNEREILALAEDVGVLHQLIFRSTKSGADVKSIFGSYLNKIIYIPVLDIKGDDALVKYQKLKDELQFACIGLSYAVETPAVDNLYAQIKKDGKRIWVNTLSKDFNAGHDDEISIQDPEKGYGYLLQKGVTVFMSDNPANLLKYLTEKRRRMRF